MWIQPEAASFVTICISHVQNLATKPHSKKQKKPKQTQSNSGLFNRGTRGHGSYTLHRQTEYEKQHTNCAQSYLIQNAIPTRSLV